MLSRTWMRSLVLIGGTLAPAAIANAQLADDVSPTRVLARHSEEESPYSASTMPLSSVPEGVTTYFWPRETTPPETARVAYSPVSYAPTLHKSSTTKAVNVAAPQVNETYPVQTTLRTEAMNTTSYPAGSLQCVCTPVGQIPQLSQSTSGSPVVMYPPATGYAPPGVYPPVYSYRPAMPVTGMPGEYYFGRGLIGQPKVYVPGQPLRNTLRFLTP